VPAPGGPGVVVVTKEEEEVPAVPEELSVIPVGEGPELEDVDAAPMTDMPLAERAGSTAVSPSSVWIRCMVYVVGDVPQSNDVASFESSIMYRYSTHSEYIPEVLNNISSLSKRWNLEVLTSPWPANHPVT
jgi:hypothetical protein